ncbi:MAG: sodium:proton antiporter [Gammaproteobacteria bacterium]|nr:MAG: sodium:proton antiporter [Gammaproteobacteria bacterium]
MNRAAVTAFGLALALISPSLLANAAAVDHTLPEMTTSRTGLAALAIFAIAYLLVMCEEFTHLRKSKPVILAAGIIWAMIAIAYKPFDAGHAVETTLRHHILEYAELGLFLLVAMTYINAMEERNVFAALRTWLIKKEFTLRQLFWITGLLAFFISPVADNLTTALLMCAVVLAVGGSRRQFVLVSCINIVIAANAGGAFSPFGDITTLMVWQKNIHTAEGVIDFWAFFALFIPSLVNWLVPAFAMSLTVPGDLPHSDAEPVQMKFGARVVVMLFLATIATAVCFHSLLELPPVVGMMTGLSYLQFFGFYLKLRERRLWRKNNQSGGLGTPVAFDVFRQVAQAEWDTLLFFYGVVICVGGLGFLGYLSLASEVMYSGWGPTQANVAVGLLSAIVDNIPVMFAVLTMMPDMTEGHWLLVTLTAGVGGSLLSIGSAAGVGLMGQARGKYTFFGHLKWTPVIALGYAASIGAHFLVNAHMFE